MSFDAIVEEVAKSPEPLLYMGLQSSIWLWEKCVSSTHKIPDNFPPIQSFPSSINDIPVLLKRFWTAILDRMLTKIGENSQSGMYKTSFRMHLTLLAKMLLKAPRPSSYIRLFTDLDWIRKRTFQFGYRGRANSHMSRCSVVDLSQKTDEAYWMAFSLLSNPDTNKLDSETYHFFHCRFDCIIQGFSNE